MGCVRYNGARPHFDWENMKHIAKISATLLAIGLSTSLWAQGVAVTGAWVRATVSGQMATGAFMTLTAKDGAKLVAVSSPVAGVAEVHEMKMDGGIMKMRAVSGGLELPAGTPVELKPGAYHVMLMDIKSPLHKDSTIALTLVFKDAKGLETKTTLQVPVSTMPPGGSMPMGHGDGAHQGHSKP